ncbi:AAA family ATPase [Xanthomonas cannabis]|uniref:AAA family ATPase n=1 Tax=Xanthomonas cannabis TaxID=1885674 RepID=UPI00141B95DA|nr:AAA family ATPase [Xanthomonas cannabis]NIK63515.1 putative ATPase [Xanthomonas cannabis]
MTTEQKKSTSESPLIVAYVGSDAPRAKNLLNDHPSIIVLGYDRWDDFNFKTTFPIYSCRIGGQAVELSSIQILVRGQQETHPYLADLLKSGWNGIFPIPSTDYISVPSELSFYEQIAGHLGLQAAVATARSLRDASLMTKVEEDSHALALVNTAGFRKSLQRENGAVRAFADGWKFFIGLGLHVENQKFRFNSAMGNELTLELRFNSPRPLPFDINVLIGPNGTGKSRLLHHIVADWLDLDQKSLQGQFEGGPNFSQVVVVSYSPFELFPVDSSESSNRKDKGDYRYFGLRGRRTRGGARTSNARSNVMLSRAFPSSDAAHSLLDCVADDQRYGVIQDWSRKVATAERVLATAIEFDYAAVAIPYDLPDQVFASFGDSYEPLGGYLTKASSEGGKVRLLPIDALFNLGLNPATIREHLIETEGVVFVKDRETVALSSGQRLFSYIVINILGAIRRNSLIIVDEPELFLHPNLEIAFLRMLKQILRAYGSKALIATHSLLAVREMPSECVHVMERTKDKVVIKTPPFETFGGDMQRISSYVFGDRSVSKPFEDWIREKLKELGSAETLLQQLGDDVNEEMIIQITAMGKGQW